jgi:hypothetical protein
VNQLALFQGTRLCGANVADQSFGYLASISRHPACFQTAFETKRTMVTHYGMNGKPDSTSPARAMGGHRCRRAARIARSEHTKLSTASHVPSSNAGRFVQCADVNEGMEHHMKGQPEILLPATPEAA